jgi:ferredoxin-fold anticodon binding domain-containing protein
MSAIPNNDAFYGGDPAEQMAEQDQLQLTLDPAEMVSLELATTPEQSLEISTELRTEMYQNLIALPIEKLAEVASAALDALQEAGANGAGPEELAMLEAYSDAAGQALMTKPDNYVWLMKTLENRAMELKAEIQRMTSRKRLFENKQERLEKRLFLFVQSCEGQKIETTRHTISLAKNPTKVDVLDLAAVPEMFKTIVPEQSVTTVIPAHTEVDEKSILSLIKPDAKGRIKREVPGCQLHQEYRLQIR